MKYKYKYKKRYNKKRNNDGTKALAIVKKLEKNVETKYKDLDVATAVSDAGAVQSMYLIAQGDSHATREGLKITVKSFFMRMRVALGSGSAQASQTLRLILFRDNQQISDSTPAVGDILETIDFDSPLALTNGGRFTVLMDKLVTINRASAEQRHFKVYKRLNSQVRFNGASSTDVQKNGLYLLYLSDINAISQPPLIKYRTRVAYTDL